MAIFLLEGDHDYLSGGGGASTIFCRLFMPHNTETFIGELFSVSLIWVIEKFYAQEGYITIFSRNFFVSLPKKSVGEVFCFSKKFWYRKCPCIGRVEHNLSGEHNGFVEFFLSDSTEKIRRGTLRYFRNFLVWKKLLLTGGVSRFYVGSF